MDRADRGGLALAIVAHVLLFAALTISIAHRPPPVRVEPKPMDVQLVETTGLQSAVPEPATAAPQQQTAPDSGPPEEATSASPQPPRPTPKPTPTPTPPTPTAPVARTVPRPVPVPKPTVETLAPAPVPTPKPVKEKPAPTAAPATQQARPAKTQPAAAAAPAATKPVASTKAAKPSPMLGSDLMSDLKAAARSEAKGAGEGKGQRTAAGRIGPDFLKGVANPAAGRGRTARAAMTGAQMNGLAAAIKRQVQPCYDLGSLGGTPAMQIITVLQLRFNSDGSIAGTPQLVEQQGVTAANRGYARQMEDVSRRAVLRCAPLKLPAELYQGGWDNFAMGFIPGQMQ